MANNLRKLRVAFLLTPKELAARIGADASDIERIEAEGFALSTEWIDAVARGLGVPASALTDPDADIAAVRKAATPARPAPKVCPIAARYALLAIIAKFAGMKFAIRLGGDDVARAVQNIITYVESSEASGDEARLTRQKLALRIAALAILQSRGIEAGPRFQTDLEEALEGASAMIHRFSGIGPEA
jgi:hypothetical protein